MERLRRILERLSDWLWWERFRLGWHLIGPEGGLA